MMEYMRPSFFIIGERKCGTSSLYRYLLQHPNVLPCQVKEPQFFTRKPWQIWWNIKKYYALFPSVDYVGDAELHWPDLDEAGRLYEREITVGRKRGEFYITGEASANTFFAAKPRIIKHFMPTIKLIVAFRNPAERCFSHYRMLERFKEEGRKVAELIDFETDMIREMDRVRKGRRGNLISPGCYVQQLEKWLKVFPREQIFVVQTEDLEESGSAQKVMEQLCDYLELPPFDFSTHLSERFNKAPKSTMPKKMRKKLGQFYAPYNQALEDLLQRKFSW